MVFILILLAGNASVDLARQGAIVRQGLSPPVFGQLSDDLLSACRRTSGEFRKEVRVSVRSLPPRPHLDQLKRQAKELLRRQPEIGRLRDAQRAIAADYGFTSWDALRSHVEAINGVASRSIIKPPELDSDEGAIIWNVLTASDDGDVAMLRELIDQDPRLSRAEYWYTPAIHFAVREGHREAVQLLLGAGADPEWNGLHDGSLIAMARERGHAQIARLLEESRDQRGRILAGSGGHPIHDAITRADTS